jgi:hypothetical protein
MSAAISDFETHDCLDEAIKAVIGSNDLYPTAVQLAVHRAKQSLQEKHFENQNIMKEAK